MSVDPRTAGRSDRPPVLLGQEIRDAFAGRGSANIVEAEIEARLSMIKFRHKRGITVDEVREMIREVRLMRKTGKY